MKKLTQDVGQLHGVDAARPFRTFEQAAVARGVAEGHQQAQAALVTLVERLLRRHVGAPLPASLETSLRSCSSRETLEDVIESIADSSRSPQELVAAVLKRLRTDE